MMHATILADAPTGLDEAALASRRLGFEVRPDDGALVTPPAPVLPDDVARELPPTTQAPSADYVGYSVIIATHPQYWTTNEGEPEPLAARRRAELLADMVRNVFPGVRCDLVPGAVEKLDLSSGPDMGVRERLETWVSEHMGEMLNAR